LTCDAGIRAPSGHPQVGKVGQQATQGLHGGGWVPRADAGRVRPYGAGRCVGGRARTGKGHRYRPGMPAGGVAGGQVTFVFQVLGERDHPGVEPGEMLIPADCRVKGRVAANLHRAEHGGDHRRDRDDRGESPAHPLGIFCSVICVTRSSTTKVVRSGRQVPAKITVRN
jgi:hypothetical protein